LRCSGVRARQQHLRLVRSSDIHCEIVLTGAASRVNATPVRNHRPYCQIPSTARLRLCQDGDIAHLRYAIARSFIQELNTAPTAPICHWILQQPSFLFDRALNLQQVLSNLRP
jgi:hypothetical protein